MRVAIKFAYDGKKFNGYARQPKLKTIEEQIINLLKSASYIDNPQKSVFRSASRTDKGASSFGNVIAFNTNKPVDNILNEINTELEEVLFYGIKKTKSDFYPRYARMRTYSYYLKNRDYNIDKILSTASIFTGTHNFSNFARIENGKNPSRTIENIVVNIEKDTIQIDFYAQTFLWNQIRRIISALIKAGTAEINIENILFALENPDEKIDFGLASAEPLVLKNIFYDFDFKYNKLLLDKLLNFKRNIISSILS